MPLLFSKMFLPQASEAPARDVRHLCPGCTPSLPGMYAIFARYRLDPGQRSSRSRARLSAARAAVVREMFYAVEKMYAQLGMIHYLCIRKTVCICCIKLADDRKNHST